MRRLLIDVSSIIWTCLLAGKDSEGGRNHPNADGTKQVLVNSAAYGLENVLSHLDTVMQELRVVPRDMIFVVEGMNSKQDRQLLHPGYKTGRDKVPAQYEEFNKVKASLTDMFLAMGSQVVKQDGGVESDDVLGYLATHLDGEVWIDSFDKDLAQVVGGDIHHYRNGKIDQNPFGEFPHELIPVYIALVGDSSDKISGCPGFGDVAWQSLHGVFGDDGLRALRQLILDKRLDLLEEDVAELKTLQKLIDNRQAVYLSYELGRLRTERVNTLRRPLQWTPGMVKPQTLEVDQRFRKYMGKVWLVSSESYDDALAFFAKHVLSSPEVALDVETSTPEESDEWIAALGKSEDRTPVDVLASELTGMGLTFGRNMQYTFYLTINHVEEPGVSNLTVDQVRLLLERIPKSKHIVVHNAAFELPVCFTAFGNHWEEDQLYHGFLPNVIDSRIMSSYADENRRANLKSLSREVLGYEQENYDHVTTIAMNEAEFVDRGSKGKVVARDAETGLVNVQYKMNELTANHVLSYGSDDTICTAALSNHFRTVMEIEGTWSIFMEIEQFPAYLTARAFLDGVNFSLESMREQEKADDEAYDKAWATLRAYLISIGFDGVHPPVFEAINRASIIEACAIVLGEEFKTLVKTPSKLAKLITQTWDTPDAQMLAMLIEREDLNGLNELVASRFSGEPQLDLASPKQMSRLLYDVMGLPVNIVNDATSKEKKEKPELAEALKKFKRRRMGHTDVILNDEELALVRKKAKSDDTSIDFALAFDKEHIDEEAQKALHALQTMKKVMTRRSLFYNNYWHTPHWLTGKIHAHANQCAAVTRRYSYSNPNLQQLPKKGEGVRFRGHFLPHHKDAVVGSVDFKAQELRIAAERSQDKNMLACYIGSRLKDVHNITAAGAMKLKWGMAAVKELAAKYAPDVAVDSPDWPYDVFTAAYKSGEANPDGKRADDLRKEAKNVNFAAQFGGQALKLSETLIMPVTDAQLFLDARSAMFPDVDKAAKRAEEFCQKTGYALTMMGARRHLREGIASDDKMEASRAARQAWNMEVQGSAGEMMKLAMTRFWKSNALYRFDARFIATIHDELVSSVHRDHAVEFLEIMHRCMTGQYVNMGNPDDPSSVPILGSISLGRNFADQIECGDDFNADAIRKAVNDAFAKEAA